MPSGGSGGSVRRRLVRVARGVARRIVVPQRRVASWLRARRTLREERLLVTQVGGWTLHYPSSSIIGRSLAEGAGWEPTLPVALDVMLARDEPLLIVEVGSNIGASLAQMISVRPQARYVCFEPADRFREVLLRNVRENGWENVVVEAALVGARAETVRLFTNTSTASVARRDYGGHAFLGASRQQVTRLDDYFRDASSLDLIKTDTDGFDIDVLLGAWSLLSRLGPVLYFEFAPFLARSAGRDSAEFLAYIGGLGYRTCLVFAQAGNPLVLTDDPREVLALAEEHKYVDVLTAVRAEHVAALPQVAATTTGGGNPSRLDA